MDAGQEDAGQDSKLQERRLCSHCLLISLAILARYCSGCAPDNFVL